MLKRYILNVYNQSKADYKRRPTDKQLVRLWAALYRYSLDNDAGQVGRDNVMPYCMDADTFVKMWRDLENAENTLHAARNAVK